MGIAVLRWRRRADSPVAEGMIQKSRGMHWERQFLLSGPHLQKVALYLWGQKVLWVPLHCFATQHTCRDICLGWLTWKQLFATLYFKIPTPALWCDCPSMTNLHHSEHNKTIPQSRSASPHYTRSLMFVVLKLSQLAWNRTQVHCAAR